MTTVSSSTSSNTTTTSSTSSSSAKNANNAAQNATKTAAQQLFNSLQAGSGIDLSTVVPSLIEAQFAAKTAALKAQSDKLTAQISDVSSIKSAITDFASALASLASGGTLATQATSSDPSTMSVTTAAGAKLAGMSKSITVNALASAQVSSTKTAFSKTASLGTGSLSIKVGAKDAVSVTFGADDSTPDLLAAKINAANTASRHRSSPTPAATPSCPSPGQRQGQQLHHHRDRGRYGGARPAERRQRRDRHRHVVDRRQCQHHDGRRHTSSGPATPSTTWSPA